MTTEPPIITRADLQAAWIAKNPKPDMRRAKSDEILAWARRWRQSDEYRQCVAITEQLETAANCTETARHGVFTT